MVPVSPVEHAHAVNIQFVFFVYFCNVQCFTSLRNISKAKHFLHNWRLIPCIKGQNKRGNP